MKKWFIPAMFIVTVLFATMIFAGTPERGDGPKNGSQAPNFTLKDTNGNQHSLTDYAGKIVIVDFWATWCPPCRKGIPDLIALQKEYKSDLVVLGITVDRDNTKKDVAPFITNNGLNYPVLWSSDAVTAAYGGIQAIPTSFVIDRQGKIHSQYVGLVEKSVYKEAIDQLK